MTARGDLGFVYSFDDLTEMRRLEREVRMQDRLAAVGRLAAAIAHEIRNPLTSIAGSVSMLSDSPALSPEEQHLLQIVIRESDRLNNIITDFLAYSRGKQYRFERVNLIPLARGHAYAARAPSDCRRCGHPTRAQLPTEEALVLADGDKLKQVFWNFSENAVRAMKKNGGKLTVARCRTRFRLGDDFSDTGPGIHPSQTEKIFEPFQSNFEGGTGLGLAIVYQIVQAHEGKVWARSEVGKGTSFVVRLRRLDRAEVIAASGSCIPRPPFRRRRCGSRRGAWVTFSSAMTNAPSANCWTCSAPRRPQSGNRYRRRVGQAQNRQRAVRCDCYRHQDARGRWRRSAAPCAPDFARIGSDTNDGSR